MLNNKLFKPDILVLKERNPSSQQSHPKSSPLNMMLQLLNENPSMDIAKLTKEAEDNFYSQLHRLPNEVADLKKQLSHTKTDKELVDNLLLKLRQWRDLLTVESIKPTLLEVQKSDIQSKLVAIEANINRLQMQKFTSTTSTRDTGLFKQENKETKETIQFVHHKKTSHKSL